MTSDSATGGKDPAERLLGRLHRVLRLWDLFQLAVWAVFLVAMPALCVFTRQAEWVIGLALLGLFLDLLGLKTLLQPLAERWQRRIVRGHVVYHAALAALGVSLLLLPVPGAWEKIAGTEAAANAVVFQGRGAPLLWMHDDRVEEWIDGEARSLGYPGGFGWVLRRDTLGIWAAPREEPRVYVLAAGQRRWSSWPRPGGHVQRGAALGGAIFLVVGSELVRVTPAGYRVVLAAPVSDVGADGQAVVAVGGSRVHVSRDGERWRSRSLTASGGRAAAHPQVCLAGSTLYIYEGGMLSGMLLSGELEGPLERRPLPASDVRVLVADPRHAREVWAGTWGRGVFQSVDGGRRWQDLGLQGVEVRELAVDWESRVAHAASANLMARRGLYVLRFR